MSKVKITLSVDKDALESFKVSNKNISKTINGYMAATLKEIYPIVVDENRLNQATKDCLSSSEQEEFSKFMEQQGFDQIYSNSEKVLAYGLIDMFRYLKQKGASF